MSVLLHLLMCCVFWQDMQQTITKRHKQYNTTQKQQQKRLHVSCVSYCYLFCCSVWSLFGCLFIVYLVLVFRFALFVIHARVACCCYFVRCSCFFCCIALSVVHCLLCFVVLSFLRFPLSCVVLVLFSMFIVVSLCLFLLFFNVLMNTHYIICVSDALITIHIICFRRAYNKQRARREAKRRAAEH